MGKRKTEKFYDWRNKIDSLRINESGLGGIFFAERKNPTPDRQECSSYVDFHYQIKDNQTVVRDVIYLDSEIKSTKPRGLAIEYLNSALKNYEAIPDSRVQTQFRLFPREGARQETSCSKGIEILPISNEQIRYFLDQRGGTLEEWGGIEGIAHYLNP